MKQITIEYGTSVHVAAGWRNVTVTAIAEKISEKRAKVTEVTKIDGDAISYKMSRTGAKRQRYNGDYVAEREVGRVKILSKCYVNGATK